jgi:erythromycin esterase-like protein
MCFVADNAAEATGSFPSPRCFHPRQWAKVSQLLNNIDERGQKYNTTINRATMFGLVGDEAGSAVNALISMAEGIPTTAQIMSSPKTVKRPKDSDRKRLYLAMETCQTMLTRVEESERSTVAEATFEYMKRTPEAFILVFISAVARTELSS